jgi:hypothetical protein
MALTIVDNPVRCEMVEQGAALRSVVPVCISVKQAPPVEDAIAKASDAELELTFSRHSQRLWRIFDRVTAVAVAA